MAYEIFVYVMRNECINADCFISFAIFYPNDGRNSVEAGNLKLNF